MALLMFLMIHDPDKVFTLPRGKSADVRLVVIDLGADSGVYDIEISLLAEPA
jgi:hypothetical protein